MIRKQVELKNCDELSLKIRGLIILLLTSRISVKNNHIKTNEINEPNITIIDA